MSVTYDERLAAADAAPNVRRLSGVPVAEGVAVVAWLAAAALTLRVEDIGDYGYTHEFGWGLAGLGAVIALLTAVGFAAPSVGARLRRWSPWFAVLALGFAAWEAATAKFELLPMPFFPPPQAVLEVYLDDYAKLGRSVLASAQLLATGYAIGAATGFVLGVAVGWSRTVSYWAHPVLRLVGPLPATAWLPLAFFVFPSSWSASTFLIALATGFPVTVLTWSGVASVHTGYYDVARTLGASRAFLILRVAIPAALPHVFVGLFMGLGASFAVLVVAEMLGVKAGVGWYLQWAQGWASYANMYAALIVMALACSGLITALFKLRDRQLGWQKGSVRW